jgi:DNA-3-methyladenine glycosylase
MHAPLPRSFYIRPPEVVARDLLGKILVHGESAGRITETEAYLGQDDLAAHSAAGITPRTRIIFGLAGHAYVYFIYGMYNCLNLVCEPEGVPGCVLIRALEPVAGLEEIRARRPNVHRDEQLANGPGKLTRALGITLRQNGADVTHGSLTVHPALDDSKIEIATTKRIGITKSPDLPLRFLIRGNPFVSKHG